MKAEVWHHSQSFGCSVFQCVLAEERHMKDLKKTGADREKQEETRERSCCCVILLHATVRGKKKKEGKIHSALSRI